jgi:hypothetical protein
MTEQRSWQTEIEPYSRRMAGLNLLTDRLKKEVSSFPGLLEFVPTDAAQVKFRSLIYVNHTLMSSRQILESVQLLWREGHLLAAAHCVRLLMELWGSLIYAKLRVVRKLPSVDGPRIAAERLTRLDLGTKSGPLLPAGLTERVEPINVMEFIRAGEKEVTDFENSYALFCDVSHPSYMHNDFHVLSDSRVIWWANPLFEKEAHRILEHITNWAEKAVSGIEGDALTIYAECRPDIQREIEQHRDKRSGRTHT